DVDEVLAGGDDHGPREQDVVDAVLGRAGEREEHRQRGAVAVTAFAVAAAGAGDAEGGRVLRLGDARRPGGGFRGRRGGARHADGRPREEDGVFQDGGGGVALVADTVVLVRDEGHHHGRLRDRLVRRLGEGRDGDVDEVLAGGDRGGPRDGDIVGPVQCR